MEKKYDRQIKFFGSGSQEQLSKIRVAIVGLGGIGSHIAQQLTFLGVTNHCLIDDDKLDETNKNRLIGVFESDPEGILKVEIMERLIKSINSKSNPTIIDKKVTKKESYLALKESDFIFGTVDNDGARHYLNEFSLAFNKPYIDCASDIDPETLEFGGRVFSLLEDGPCLYCLEELDTDEVREFLENSEAREDQEAVYGINKKYLRGGGPAVVSLNGIIASIAVNEFLVSIAKLRRPQVFLSYYGSRGIINERICAPDKACYYCNNVKGKKDRVNFERYFTLK